MGRETMGRDTMGRDIAGAIGRAIDGAGRAIAAGAAGRATAAGRAAAAGAAPLAGACACALIGAASSATARTLAKTLTKLILGRNIVTLSYATDNGMPGAVEWFPGSCIVPPRHRD
jgi:hypothetical protein